MFLSGTVFITVFAQTENSRLAFINPDGQVATINADGSELQLLSEGSEGAARYQFPTWSPDGSVVAAIGLEASRGIIDLFDASASRNRVLESTQDRPFYMYWSPDSKTISYLANNPEAGLAMSFVDVERKESRARAFGSPFYWQWTADSSKLFIHQGVLDGQLGFIDAEGNAGLEENISEIGLFRSPGISASEDYIAYASGGVRGTEIRLEANPLSTEDKEDTGNTSLSEVSRALPYDGFTAMSWSPTEDQLAFILPTQANMSSFGNLAMMDAETGLLETLSEESVIAFFWSPDGRYIMYLVPQRVGGSDFARDLVLNELYGSASSTKRITESYLAQSDEIELAVNIIDIDTLEESYLTSVRPTPLFINQFVPFFEQYALSHNIWSADSQAIALPTRDREGNSNIAVIYVEDGRLDVIAEGTAPFWQH